MTPMLAILMLCVSARMDYSSLLPGQALAMVVGAACTWRLLARGQDRSERYRMDRSTWRLIVPLGVGTGLSVLASRLPMLFVGGHSALQAAHYDIGQRVHSAATLASQSAATVFLPRVRRLAVERRTRQLAWELIMSTAIGLAPALAITLGLLLVGPERTEEMLGPEYAGTWTVAVLLSVAAVLNTGTGLCHGLLAMTGNSRSFLVIAMVQCIVVIGYGLFVFTGSAVEMAQFFIGAELFRGLLLLALVVGVFRSLSASGAYWEQMHGEVPPAPDETPEQPPESARGEGRLA
jgi:O-antigen/teichoic acid export membrane protein